METIDDEIVGGRDRFHHAAGRGRQAVLLLVQFHPHAFVHAPMREELAVRPAVGNSDRICRRHDRARQNDRERSSTRSMISASPTTPSCIYTTDNGPHQNTWPDAGMTPFRSEKNTNWEGAFRVPLPDPLAWQDSARHRSRMRSCSISTGCRRSWPRPATRTSTTSCSRATRRSAGPPRSISTATTSFPT